MHCWFLIIVFKKKKNAGLVSGMVMVGVIEKHNWFLCMRVCKK